MATSMESLNIRIGERTGDIIEHVVNSRNTYSSIKDFCEGAVRNNITEIEELSSGTEDIRRFVKELTSVSGINHELDDGSVSTKIQNEDLNRQTKVKLSAGTLSTLTDIQSSTDMNASKVVRACVLRELNVVAETSLDAPLDSRVQSAWMAIEDDIMGQLVQLKAILEQRFVWQKDQTKTKLKQEPHEASRVSQYYQNYFKESKGYELIEANTQDEIVESIEDVLSGFDTE